MALSLFLAVLLLFRQTISRHGPHRVVGYGVFLLAVSHYRGRFLAFFILLPKEALWAGLILPLALLALPTL